MNANQKVDMSEIGRQLAMLGDGLPTIEILEEAIARDIAGIDVTSPYESKTLELIGDGTRIATLVQLLYLKALARTQRDKAACLLAKLDQLQDMDLLDEFELVGTQID